MIFLEESYILVDWESNRECERESERAISSFIVIIVSRSSVQPYTKITPNINLALHTHAASVIAIFRVQRKFSDRCECNLTYDVQVQW